MKISRRRILIAVWVIGLLTPFVWAVRLLFGRPAPVAVSVGTTFLTGETLADGSLDFSRALWQHCNFPIDDSVNAGIELARLPDPPDARLLHVGFQPDLPQKSLRTYEGAQVEHRRSLRYTVEGRRAAQELFAAAERPWTRDELPYVAQVIDAEREYARQWKSAIRKPRLQKPTGVTVRDLWGTLLTGARILERRAMLAAGEQRWPDMVEDLQAMDHAADLLAELQCGWETARACQLRTSVSDALAAAVMEARHVDPVLASYIRSRSAWPVHEVVVRAADHATRIQAQVAVRDVREHDGVLSSYVAGGLVGNDPTAVRLQLNQIRNSIDWSTVSRIQNDVLSQFVDSLSQPNLTRCREQWQVAYDDLAKWDDGDLTGDLRKLDLSNITERLGYALAKQSWRRHLKPLLDARLKVEYGHHKSLAALVLADYREQNETFPDRIELLPQEVVDLLFADVSEDAVSYQSENGKLQLSVRGNWSLHVGKFAKPGTQQ